MRIQILNLPDVTMGEQTVHPFVIVVDQVTDRDNTEQAAISLVQDIGAVSCWVTSETVEVIQ